MTVVSSEKKRVESPRWMTEEKKPGPAPHSLVVENRERLTATGVTDVGSYNDQVIETNTGEGQLVIRGEGLHIDRLNLESGELIVTGRILSMAYAESRPAGSFLSRLLR